MGQKRQVQIDGSKETDPNRPVQINWSKKTEWSKYIQIGSIWAKIKPNGSGITRSPGLVSICISLNASFKLLFLRKYFFLKNL